MKRALVVAVIGTIHLIVAFLAGASWWLILLIAGAFAGVEAILLRRRALRAVRRT